MTGHGARAQRKIIRRVGREGQRGIIVGGGVGRSGGVKAGGGGHAVGGHGDGGVRGEGAGGTGVPRGTGASIGIARRGKTGATIFTGVGVTSRAATTCPYSNICAINPTSGDPTKVFVRNIRRMLAEKLDITQGTIPRVAPIEPKTHQLQK